MVNKKKIVIIGATSAMAQHCARLWAKDAPAQFVLVARDLNKLVPIVEDLKVRSPDSTISQMVVNFTNAGEIQELVEEVAMQGPIDIALIAHGTLPDQAAAQAELSVAEEALEINGISPVLFAEAFVGAMLKAGHGQVAIIGSVAGERGRKSNYVYGAAKGLVTRYVEGLHHRLASTNIKVSLIKPGPTDTPMTAHLKSGKGKMAPVEQVAQEIVSGIAKGKRVIYTPGKWALIMLIIRNIPHFIFKKMDI